MASMTNQDLNPNGKQTAMVNMNSMPMELVCQLVARVGTEYKLPCQCVSQSWHAAAQPRTITPWWGIPKQQRVLRLWMQRGHVGLVGWAIDQGWLSSLDLASWQNTDGHRAGATQMLLDIPDHSLGAVMKTLIRRQIVKLCGALVPCLVSGGHLDLLRWARAEYGCLLRGELIEQAIASRRLAIVKWLTSDETLYPKCTLNIRHALLENDNGMLKWMIEHSAAVPNGCSLWAAVAARQGDRVALARCCDQGSSIAPQVFEQALLQGDPSFFGWLLKRHTTPSVQSASKLFERMAGLCLPEHFRLAIEHYWHCKTSFALLGGAARAAMVHGPPGLSILGMVLDQGCHDQTDLLRLGDYVVSDPRCMPILELLAARNITVYDRHTILSAAVTGAIAPIQQLQLRGCPLTAIAFAKAAENGHTALLEWLTAHGCPWDAIATVGAARSMNLCVLRYLERVGRLRTHIFIDMWQQNIQDSAEDIQVLTWLFERGMRLVAGCQLDGRDVADCNELTADDKKDDNDDSSQSDNHHSSSRSSSHSNSHIGGLWQGKARLTIAQSTHARIIAWAYCNGHLNRKELVTSCPPTGHVDLYRIWLPRANINDVHAVWNSENTRELVQMGDLARLRWIVSQGAPINSQTVISCAAHGHVSILKWLLEDAGLTWTKEAEAEAARRGQLHLLCWVHAQGMLWRGTSTFEAALSSRLLDLVRWLDAVGCAWCPRSLARKFAKQQTTKLSAGPGDTRCFPPEPWSQELADWVALQGDRPCRITHGCCSDEGTLPDTNIHHRRPFAVPVPALGIGKAYYRETAAAISATAAHCK